MNDKWPRRQATLEEIENINEIPKYLEKEELAIFLRTAQNTGLRDDYTIFLVLAYTGIRVGELCALKWSDVDFVKHTIKFACYQEN